MKSVRRRNAFALLAAVARRVAVMPALLNDGGNPGTIGT